MSSVKTNILANFIGRAVAALVSLLLIPVYIRYLGIEAYGLVGLLALLTALFGILDLGVTPTINRELARLSTRPGAALLVGQRRGFGNAHRLYALALFELCRAEYGVTI